VAQLARVIADDGIEAGERRAAVRVELGRRGTLRLGDGAPLDVLISDLTRDGCRIETDAALEPGLAVQIGIAHLGLTPGRIVRRSTSGYGCRFDVPLDAGAVTLASGATNVAAFPGTALPAPAPAPAKLSPRAQFGAIAGAAVAGWGAVAALGFALLR
jgi:hypothetical protein